jgi:hypothetical protein
MLTRFVLSTGEITGRVERYVMDLFHMHLHVYKGDIPLSDFGFNSNFGDVKKDELVKVVREKAVELCRDIAGLISGINLELESVNLVSEDRAVLSIRVNDERQNFEMNI